MARIPAGLWKKYIAVQIYGANTDVGKTVFSTILGLRFKAGLRDNTYHVQYIKPVSTGPGSDRDDAYVQRYTGQSVSTLYQFSEPVSPHVAARGSMNSIDSPSDRNVIQRLHAQLRDNAFAIHPTRPDDWGLGIVETAGGVLSPGPSGTPQADIYRSLRLPAILVGDHKLGGIASTISAAESLIMRGYDLDAVVCFDDKSKYENSQYLRDYFLNRGIAAFSLPWIPESVNTLTGAEEHAVMKEYYRRMAKDGAVRGIANLIVDRHQARVLSLESMASRTHDKIWHPFTQHKHVENADDILVFDSAYGDFFQVKRNVRSDKGVNNKHQKLTMLYPAFDGSASWWTQGLGHGDPKLALAAAYAAGRYGHVMFAGATHEPALTLAERLLKGLKNPRLRKVFYTDDGSTATEVGIKMGVRAACKHYEWDGSKEAIGVLGLKGSYHGDTIGAMDASEPCVYNEKVDWYRGRGYWFDYPTFKMRAGRWIVEPPRGMEEEFGAAQEFSELDDVFDFATRGHSPRYEAYIEKTLDKLVKEQGRKFGALVMEPVILGAGGMIFVDPLFQKSLARVVRRYDFSVDSSKPTPSVANNRKAWTGLPVMFDEVFTGLYRLGRFSSASFLNVHPDISVHAKLLTGGLLPLSITAASNSIFQAFWGDEKSEALLHGHSYTAHPIGCHVANVSLSTMDHFHDEIPWDNFRKSWKTDRSQTSTKTDQEQWSMKGLGLDRKDNLCWSFWSKEFVTKLSMHKRVDHVNALGSVLAVSLKDESGAGYTSSAAVGLRDALLYDKGLVQIHSRILGNVIYLMASMTTKATQLKAVQETFMSKLDNLDQV